LASKGQSIPPFPVLHVSLARNVLDKLGYSC
jgi:hypothetical protein